jgi:hypothetical protein
MNEGDRDLRCCVADPLETAGGVICSATVQVAASARRLLVGCRQRAGQCAISSHLDRPACYLQTATVVRMCACKYKQITSQNL